MTHIIIVVISNIILCSLMTQILIIVIYMILGVYIEYLSDAINKEYAFLQEKCFEPFLEKNLPAKRSSAFKKALQATEQEREAIDKVVDVCYTTTMTIIIDKFITEYTYIIIHSFIHSISFYICMIGCCQCNTRLHIYGIVWRAMVRNTCQSVHSPYRTAT